MGSGISSSVSSSFRRSSREEYQLRSLPSVFEDYYTFALDSNNTGFFEQDRYTEIMQRVLRWVKHLKHMDLTLVKRIGERLLQNMTFLMANSNLSLYAVAYGYEFQLYLEMLALLQKQNEVTKLKQFLVLGSDFLLKNKAYVKCSKAQLECFADLFKVHLAYETTRVKGLNRMCSSVSNSDRITSHIIKF